MMAPAPARPEAPPPETPSSAPSRARGVGGGGGAIADVLPAELPAEPLRSARLVRVRRTRCGADLAQARARVGGVAGLAAGAVGDMRSSGGDRVRGGDRLRDRRTG